MPSNTMPNPCLQVPIADYEAHMVLSSLAQSQLLATTLHSIVATLVQLPADGFSEVSVSPFPNLMQLQLAFRFVSPAHLHDSLSTCGLTRVADEFYNLATGKSFLFAAYQLTK